MSQQTNTAQLVPQNRAEEYFVECMKSGHACKIGKDDTCPQKPEHRGEDANVIRADLIRAFALGGNASPNHIRLEGVWVTGELNLSFADIGGALAFLRCHFEEVVVLLNAECRALYMNGSYLSGGLWGDGIQVKGMISFRGKFVSQEGVSLPQAKIGGDLDCIDSVFNNLYGENAFFVDGAKIGGCLRLVESEFQGQVKLNGVSVGKHLECRGATFNKGIEIAAAEIKNVLVFINIKGGGLCNLSDTRMGGIQDDDASRAKFNFSLYGLVYRHFTVPGDIKSRIDWLHRRPIDTKFSPQPFQQAAKVLFVMGHDNDARKILLKKERRLTKQKGILQKPWRWLWDAFAGYGYQPWKTLIAIVAFIAAGECVFDHADESHRIVPHQPIVLKMLKDRREQPKKDKCADKQRPTEVVECLLPEYPRFHSLAYSADVFIPFFALHMESHWYPQGEDGDTDIALRLLRLWYWIEIIAGWILTSLLVLTITGLLKPRQSSLE